jgi:ABC-type dipeptide/oligopeptide/nickel transport system permease component
LSAYVLRRLVLAVPTLVGVTLVVFALIRLVPGDPARLVLGLQASEEEVQRLRVQLGLDQPLPVQYARFLARLLQGDLGRSVVTGEPVLREIGARLPATVQLAVTSTVVATLAGVAAGVVSATRQYSWWDYAVMTVALFGISLPVFWLGLMLMLLFSVHLRWLPAGGYGTPAHLVLPTVTLAAFSVAIIARMTRSSLLEVLHQDYVRTAWAKGLNSRAVVLRHALKNALIPVVTVIGLQFGGLLGGAILTETVFAWPGMGRLLVGAIVARDYPVVQGTVLVFAALFTLVNLAVDVLYAYVDPRIHYG